MSFNSFTFRLEIQLIDIYDIQKNTIITPLVVNDIIKPIKTINVPIETFEWTLTKSSMYKARQLINTQKMCSEIFTLFGLKWRIIIYPDGINKYDKGSVNIKLESISLQNKSMIQKVMHFEWDVFIKETNTKCPNTVTYTSDNYIQSWGTDRISTLTFKSLDNCIISITIKWMGTQTLNHSKQFLSIKTELNELKRLINNDLLRLY